jgi:Peptidase family M1 domain
VRRFFEIAAGLGLAWAAGRAALAALPQPAGSAAPEAPAGQAARGYPPPPPAGIAPPIGPMFDGDSAMTLRPAPVASYTLRASLDGDKHTIHGEGRIAWKNASRAPVHELWVHLYMNAYKNDRTLFLRVPLEGGRGTGETSSFGWIQVTRFAVKQMDGADLWPGADPTSPGDPDDETDIRVPLPRAVEPGERVDIDVAWDEQLPALTFRTGHMDGFHFVGQWFPKIARLEPDGRWAHFAFHHLSEFAADFGTYDVTLETPEAMVVGATGRLAGESHTENGRAFRRYLQEDVHDFAFTAWSEFRELDAASEDGAVAIRCLYPPGFERAAASQVEEARFGLTYFGKAYGRYPYGTLTLVHPPDGAEEAGGMEYPTLITTGGPFYLPISGTRLLELVTLHELGHQWFYGLVASDEHAWPFLDEGINSYAEADVSEARYPNTSAASFPFHVGLPGINRADAAERSANAPVAQPASSFITGGDYGGLVYERTATILLTLGRVYGEDRVRRAVGRYARRYRFDHPGPAELLGAFDEVVGHDAAEALRAALFDRATVDYAVASISSGRSAAPLGIFGDPTSPGPAPAAPSAAYTGSVLVRRRGALRFPVDVDLYGEDGAVQRVRWEAQEAAARLPYTGSSPLVAAVIDPEHRVLLDENLLNNARRSGRSSVGGASLERAVLGAELGLEALLP